MIADAARTNCAGLSERHVSGVDYDEGIKAYGGCFLIGSRVLVAEFINRSGQGQAEMAG